jgi:hypothetical protein
VTYGEFQSWACANRSDERAPEEGCGAGYGIAPLLRDRFGVPSFNKTDFNMARINVLQVRQAVLGGPAVKPWLAFKGFCWECEPSAYYAERVFHLALAGAADFYYFFAWTVGIDGYRVKLADHALVSTLLGELTALVGCEERRWVVDGASRWEDDFLLSGMNLPRGDTVILHCR